MKIGKQLAISGATCVLASVLWYNLLMTTNPLAENGQIWIHWAFFFSLFLGLLGFFHLLFFFGSEIVLGKKLGNTAYWIAFRRAFLLVGYIVTLVVLQWFRLFGPLEAVLLAIFGALLEYTALMARR